MMRERGFSIGLFMVIVLLSTMTLSGSAQSTSDNPCIILAQSEEMYVLGLSSIDSNTEYQITISFNYTQSVTERLDVHDTCTVVKDLLANNIYYLSNKTVGLCTVKYAGLEQVLLGEQRARLEITSENFLVYVVGIDTVEQSIELDIPQSFQIIVALCSLVPFFLLVPDAITELQMHLDAEAMSKGVYGHILALLLPLLSIGLTFLLLGGLDVFK